jgi:small subunit ribosomal protein S6
VNRYLSVKIAEDIDPETRPVQEDVKLAGDVDDGKVTFGGAERDAYRGYGDDDEGMSFDEGGDER